MSMNNLTGREISPKIKQLGEFIEKHFAIQLSETNYQALKYFIPRRLSELKLSFTEYLNLLVDDHKNHGSEIKALLDEVTVQETYFFRDSGQFQALIEKVLPNLIEEKKYERSLRIWSAGCSTGEEPYTIAIILQEYFSHILDWNILIRATDINVLALKKAREGIYTKHSFRGVRKNYIEKYFRPVGNRFALSESVKKMVQFDYFNLASDSFLPVGRGNQWDIIFCRNVLIYFHRQRIVSLLDRFHEALRPNGFLFLGFSENLHLFPNKFEAVHYENSFFYKKEESQKVPKETGESRRSKRTLPAKVMSGQTREKSAIHKDARFVQFENSFEQKFQRVQELFSLEFYRQAWEKLRQLGPVPQHRKLDVLFLTARLQVNLLRWEDADETLQLILQDDPLFKEAYFLRALISRNESDLHAAVTNFRKVLYVDPDYVLARLYLGDLFRMLGQNDLALREYRNAHRILEKNPRISLGPFAAGFTADVLVQTFENKIKIMEKKQRVDKPTVSFVS